MATMDALTTAAESFRAYLQQQPPAISIITALLIISITTRFISGQATAQTSPTTTGAKTATPVPYYLPLVGHIPQMLLRPSTFLSNLRALHKSTGSFALNILGSTHTILFRPGLSTALINTPTHIADADAVSFRLMKTNFGWPSRDSAAYARMLPDVLAQYAKLTSEPALGALVSRTVEVLRHHIADFVTFNESEVDQAVWERLAGVETTEDGVGDVVVEASLFELVRNFVAVTANPALLGSNFVDNFPDFWTHLWMYDEAFLPLIANLPRWVLYPSVIRARRAMGEMMKCIREFEVAMEADRNGEYPGAKWSDLDGVSALIRGRVDEVYRKHEMTIEQRASCEFALIWAMNANSNPLVFWMLWRIYSDTELLARIRAEVAPFVVPEEAAAGFGSAVSLPTRIDKIDVEGLMSRCPLIKAAYIETLRLDVTARSFKVIREDVVLGDRDGSAEKLLLRKGTFAHAMHDLHHTNPEYFEDPEEWRVDRHIKWDAANEEGEKVPTVSMGSIRPYDGGVSMYKGRQFAGKEILVFSAAILTMYEMEPAGGGPWKLPKAGESIGTKRPTSSTRVWIKARKRPAKIY